MTYQPQHSEDSSGGPSTNRPYAEPTGSADWTLYGTNANPYLAQPSPHTQLSPYNPYATPDLIRPEHPNANLVLILGIVSLFTGITGPFAWYFGWQARRDMNEHPGRYAQSGSLTAGLVLGIITSIGMIIGALFVLLVIFAFAAWR